jgi:hypothetical protein
MPSDPPLSDQFAPSSDLPIGRAPSPPTGRHARAVDQTADATSDEYYFPVAIHKLIVMSVCTFGAYVIYWFYRQWKFMRASGDPRIRPVWRAIFSGIFAYPLFRRIRDDADSGGVPIGWSPGVLTFSYIALGLLFRSPGPLWPLGFTYVLPLVSVQQTVLRLNMRAVPSVHAAGTYSAWNIVGIVFGGALILFGFLGSFLPRN